jgi:hypothetical protein
MTMPNFKSQDEANRWLKDKIKSFVDSYEKSKNIEEKRESLKKFSLNDFKAEEISHPQMKGILINQSAEYLKIKNELNNFFEWMKINRQINPGFEIYLDGFFSKSHSQKMPLIANEIQRFSSLNEIEQIKGILEIYKTTYEISLNHLKTLLEIIFKKNNLPVTKDFGLKELKENFADYPRINNLLNLFDNYSRNPVGHETWTYEEGKLLFKSKGVISEIKIETIIQEILNHIMFQMAYQALAIEGYQAIIKEDKLSETQMDKLYTSFKKFILS